MRKIVGLFLATAVAGMVGCTKSQDGISYVRIAPSIQTRVTGLHFDAGDQIGLSVMRGSETFVTNCVMTYDGEAFAAPDLVWYSDLDQTSTLTAYYPYSDKGVPARFSIAADQRDGLASSDMLVAVRKDVKPSATPVGMLFYHVMSQLSVIVVNTSSSAVTGVTIEGLSPEAEIDFSVPSAKVVSGAAVAVKTCCVTPDARYRAILVPQQAALTVCVETQDGKQHRETLSSALLESGKRYDLSVLVTNLDISLSLSGEINDWQDGGDLGGDSKPENPGTVDYGGQTYTTMKLGGRIWMAENLRYQPAGVSVGTGGLWNPAGGPSQLGKQGYLYNYAVATAGVSATTDAPLQGICPAGWHIPDENELAALAADTNCPSNFFACAGYMIVRLGDESYSAPTKGHLMGATQTEGVCKTLSYSSTSAAVASSVSVNYGISVRCVKNVN